MWIHRHRIIVIVVYVDIEVGDINEYFTLAYIFSLVCCIICVIYVYHYMYDNIMQISNKADNSKIRVCFWHLICLRL